MKVSSKCCILAAAIESMLLYLQYILNCLNPRLWYKREWAELKFSMVERLKFSWQQNDTEHCLSICNLSRNF